MYSSFQQQPKGDRCTVVCGSNRKGYGAKGSVEATTKNMNAQRFAEAIPMVIDAQWFEEAT